MIDIPFDNIHNNINTVIRSNALSHGGVSPGKKMNDEELFSVGDMKCNALGFCFLFFGFFLRFLSSLKMFSKGSENHKGVKAP